MPVMTTRFNVGDEVWFCDTPRGWHLRELECWSRGTVVSINGTIHSIVFSLGGTNGMTGHYREDLSVITRTPRDMTAVMTDTDIDDMVSL